MQNCQCMIDNGGWSTGMLCRKSNVHQRFEVGFAPFIPPCRPALPLGPAQSVTGWVFVFDLNNLSLASQQINTYTIHNTQYIPSMLQLILWPPTPEPTIIAQPCHCHCELCLDTRCREQKEEKMKTWRRLCLKCKWGWCVSATVLHSPLRAEHLSVTKTDNFITTNNVSVLAAVTCSNVISLNLSRKHSSTSSKQWSSALRCCCWVLAVFCLLFSINLH